MKLAAKPVLFGAGIGVVLVLVLLQAWGTYLDNSITQAAQPNLIRPLNSPKWKYSPVAYENFQRPWFSQPLGPAMSNWKISSLDGQATTLGQLKGKVVFLNFWSTSCVPCIEEMPGIAKLYSSLHDDRIAFVAAAQDSPVEVKSFLSKNSVGVPVYTSEQEPSYPLLVQGVPTTFIIGRNGDLLFMHTGPLNWNDDKARDYLADLASALQVSK